MRTAFLLLTLLLFAAPAAQSGGEAFFGLRAQENDSLQTADLGECVLESGERILDCTIGYRTFGMLNQDRSNAVLFPTWFTGTTEYLVPFIDPAGYVDPDEYFVVAVEAFGNGISSSPSTSERQAGRSFPRFTISDMVTAQRRLLTEVLEIDSLHAVVGISMGGMQALEWAVRYPEFADRIASIVGTPRPGPYDLLVLEALRRSVADCAGRCPAGAAQFSLLMDLVVRTADEINARLSREDVRAQISALDERPPEGFEAADIASQLDAAVSHDIGRSFAGGLEEAAATIPAELMVVTGARDLIVTPGPAREFARAAGAAYHEIDSVCGHATFTCEADRIGPLVRAFLSKKPD